MPNTPDGAQSGKISNNLLDSLLEDLTRIDSCNDLMVSVPSTVNRAKHYSRFSRSNYVIKCP